MSLNVSGNLALDTTYTEEGSKYLKEYRDMRLILFDRHEMMFRDCLADNHGDIDVALVSFINSLSDLDRMKYTLLASPSLSMLLRGILE